MNSADCCRGGVVGPSRAVDAKVVRCLGTSRMGYVPVRGLVPFPVVGNAEKIASPPG